MITKKRLRDAVSIPFVNNGLRIVKQWIDLLVAAIPAGPSTTTDNAVVRWDGTGGTGIQNSAFVVDDTGHVTSFGGNISFPATQSSSADANTLDDYEEGTFVPTIAGDATAGTQTYAAQLGRYIKVGKLVHFQIRILLTAKDAATAGNLIIAGLPFTAATSNAEASVAIGAHSNFDLDVAGARYQLGGRVDSAGTSIKLFESGDNVALAALTAADFGNTTQIYCSGTYEAAA